MLKYHFFEIAHPGFGTAFVYVVVLMTLFVIDLDMSVLDVIVVVVIVVVLVIVSGNCKFLSLCKKKLWAKLCVTSWLTN